MRRETAVILLLIAVVLLPMWYVALTSGTEGGGIGVGTGAEPVAVNTSSDLQPASGYLPGPVEVGVNQAGVVAWVALLGMVGVMVGTKRFLDRISHLDDSVVADGGRATVSVPPYMETESRRILDYVPAVSSRTGLLVVALLSWVDVSFAALLTLEGLGPARTQFLGTYAGMLFLSLALTVLAYTAYFVPSITVAETRDH
ncbi:MULTISPECIES: hypothetical protein [Haloferax]|uniref:Uncharacterized protein n=1 Tax=Haloferax massiliensis TaxID=1476858 RepID=A0A0D6JNI5_9EURY|nr:MULTISPECIES: hypothetical protein [Haloferax]MDS0241072.1 hypothetical protein [Haloferax sp. S2CR25]MDS0444193.1 hypothetical protein [Haloferax sp. S2CR25-2]CQR49456.1 hypothetical protein BN996_00917 [Haloferax massiliensis]